jgi:hypothetical protein
MLVYLHRRITDNEVFYVGIGSTRRAYSKSSRNKHWNDIVSKHGFKVDITHNNLLREDACLIERYLIEFYKSYSKCKLANKTNGGDGTDTEQSLILNKIRWSDPIQKIKHLERNKLRWSNPEEKEKLKNRNIKRFSKLEERKKVSIINKKRFSNPEARKNNSEKMKLFWANLTDEKRKILIDKFKKPKIKRNEES